MGVKIEIGRKRAGIVMILGDGVKRPFVSNDFDEYYYVARFVFSSYNYICRKYYALWRM